ncbi:MAG: hypothetical protein AAF926_00285, partial [Pseudomonadota bacterium]
MRTHIIDLTPEIASVLLSRNPKSQNRTLNAAYVEGLARDMSSGRWDGLNGQTIVVSKCGYLNDGQHRCNAIVASGVTVKMLVVFGAERDARLTIDQNRTRSAADNLGIVGMKNTASVAAITSAFMSLLSGARGHSPNRGALNLSKANRPTKQEIRDYAVKH